MITFPIENNTSAEATLPNSGANASFQFFNKLFDTQAPKINGFIIQRLQAKEKAEELLESVFHEAWKKIEIFMQPGCNHFIELLKIAVQKIKTSS